MRFSWLLVTLFYVKTRLVAGYVYDADYLIPRECDLCLASTCPQLTYCVGEVVKDHCGCCQICSSDLFPKQPKKHLSETPVEEPATGALDSYENKSDDPCEKRRCPKFKVCMKNVQGLPICACPSSFVCKNHGNRGKSEEICGSDGQTYDSKCHLRIASCNAARRIKRKHEGVCTDADVAEINSMMERKDFNEIDFGKNIDKQEAEYLANINRAKKRRLRQKKKKEKKKRRQRKRERKERAKKKGNRRQKRMKRRNDGYNMYSKRYGYLIGKHTKWGRSQVRKSRI